MGNSDDDDALADEVRSFSSSASMDGDDEVTPERERLNPLMNNASARMSHLEVYTSAQGSASDALHGHPVHRKQGSGGLAAKAGIILVRIFFLCLNTLSEDIISQRVSIIFSW